MARAHDITKSQRRRHGNLQKRIPGNHERGATGHNTKMTLFSIIFVHAHPLLWGIKFTPAKIWSKSIFHILMSVWWWDFDKLSPNFGFLQEKNESAWYQDDFVFCCFCSFLPCNIRNNFYACNTLVKSQ